MPNRLRISVAAVVPQLMGVPLGHARLLAGDLDRLAGSWPRCNGPRAPSSAGPCDRSSLARLDPRLATGPPLRPPLPHRFRRAEQVRVGVGLQPGLENRLALGPDVDFPRSCHDAPSCAGLGCRPRRPRTVSRSPVRMMTTSPGRIPVNRWSSIMAQTWRLTNGRTASTSPSETGLTGRLLPGRRAALAEPGDGPEGLVDRRAERAPRRRPT